MNALPFGTWPSPISTGSLTAALARLDEVVVDGLDTYWLEGRPWEQGRTVLVRHSGSTGETADVTAPPWNVRSRVHEYGGGAYAVQAGTVVFSHFADGRLRRLDPGAAEPVAITPEAAVRFGALVLHGDRVYAVREDHREGGEPRNELVSLDLHGGNADLGVVLSSGTDFVSRPAISADGSRIAWVSWNHPDMPWDSTILHEARLTGDGLAQISRIAGGPGVAVVQPAYDPSGRLWFFSDETNWWNPWIHEDGGTRQVLDVAADLAGPQWVLGIREITFLDDGRAVLAAPDRSGLILLSADGRSTRVQVEQTHLESLWATGDRVALKRGLDDTLPQVVSIEVPSGEVTVLARSSPDELDPAYISRAQAVTWTNSAGLLVHGNFYAPTHPELRGPSGQAPPLLVFVHGGPTGQASPSLQWPVQFWTSRGFAVLDVDHGGSSGYGRDYRERLRGQWGVVDIDDCVTGAAAMAQQGRADGDRLAIRGGSAGGYTTLRALTTSTVFAAGTSLFGISDLAALMVDDHKFESHYSIGLVGPWPQARAVYAERSPINHVQDLHGELLLLQGADDLVVPAAQSQLLADAMRAAGKKVELVIYPGEGHGFRQAANVQDAFSRELAHYLRVFAARE